MTEKKPDNAIVPLQSGRLMASVLDSDRAGRNPAVLYLMSRRTSKSRRTTQSALNTIAVLHGYRDYLDMDWTLLSRTQVMFLMEVMSLSAEELEKDPRLAIFLERSALLRRPGYKWKAKSISGLRLYLSVLKGVAKEAYLCKQLDRDDYEAIRLVSLTGGKPPKRYPPIKAQQLMDLIAAVASEGTAIAARDAAIMALLYGAGLRRDEIRMLKLSNIDFQGHAITFRGKGNKIRRVPLNPAIEQYLAHWIDTYHHRASEHVFCAVSKGGKLSRAEASDQLVYSMLKRRLLAAGIDDVSPHDLRRLFATGLLEEDVPIQTVSNLMGHEDINTTTRYNFKDEEAGKAAISKLPGVKND